MSKKAIEKKLKEEYLELFLNSLEDEYKKKDLRTYADHDDWAKVNYIGPMKQLNNTNKFQFQIKKSYLRLRLRVRINDGHKDIVLFQDFLFLKKKNFLKKSILNIVEKVELNILLSNSTNPVALERKIKLTKLCQKH